MEKPDLRLITNGVVLQVQGVAGGSGRMPPVATYVMECDFEANNGIGTVIFTHNREHAKHFDSPIEALSYWRTQSKTVPLRPDGKPNRPLTAYNICILRDGTRPM